MRTLFSATLFCLSFFLLGDSHAPEPASTAHSSLVSVFVARPLAELCTPTTKPLVVVLMPGGGSVWSLDAALGRSLELTLEAERLEEERDPPWWSLERVVASRLGLKRIGASAGEKGPGPGAREGWPVPATVQTLGLEGPL